MTLEQFIEQTKDLPRDTEILYNDRDYEFGVGITFSSFDIVYNHIIDDWDTDRKFKVNVGIVFDAGPVPENIPQVEENEQ